MVVTFLILCIGYVLSTLQQNTVGSGDRVSEVVSTSTVRTVFSEASILSSQGDYAKAADILRPLLSKNLDDAQGFILRYTLATNDFMTGDEQARINAVALLKEQFTSPSISTENKVLLISRLLLFDKRNVKNDSVYDAIFAGEPFSHLKVPGDHTASIVALAGYSNTLAPSSDTYFNIAQILIGQCALRDKATNAHGALQETDITTIEKNIALMEANTDDLTDLPVGAQSVSLQKIILYSLLTHCDPKYLSEAQDLLVEINHEYERGIEDAEVSESNTNRNSIAQNLVIANLFVADALYRVQGDDAWENIENLVTQAVAMVNGNSSLHRGLDAFLQDIRLLEPEEQKKTYPSYFIFVERIPVFRIFLEEKGFIF